MKKDVAIIGAGLSGLSCAQALRSAGINVRLYESASFLGGRCATQLWQGHLVDHGVQYFTAQTTEFKKELLTSLRQFRPIISPIVNQQGEIINSQSGPRFYVLQGNNYFAHVLSQGLDIRLNSPVTSLNFTSSGIECLGETYAAVVSAIPAPLTSRLFNLGYTSTSYAPAIVALLEYAGTSIGNSRECYARLMPEGKEPIFSSYCENNKVGRIVGSKTVFVVQATPRFSKEYFDTPPEDYLPLLISEHENIWEIPAGECTAKYGHRWTYGRPLDDPRHRIDPPRGAFYCGDAHADSTVEGVWIDGRKTAEEVLAYVSTL